MTEHPYEATERPYEAPSIVEIGTLQELTLKGAARADATALRNGTIS